MTTTFADPLSPLTERYYKDTSCKRRLGPRQYRTYLDALESDPFMTYDSNVRADSE
jgi:hypothetical protein